MQKETLQLIFISFLIFYIYFQTSAAVTKQTVGVYLLAPFNESGLDNWLLVKMTNNWAINRKGFRKKIKGYLAALLYVIYGGNF